MITVKLKMQKEQRSAYKKKTFKLNIYKNYLLNNKVILKLQQSFKSEAHNVYTEEVNKIALSSNDDERLQAYDLITSYLYG